MNQTTSSGTAVRSARSIVTAWTETGLCAALSCAAVLATAGTARAQGGADRTQAAYFMITSEVAQPDPMPLKETSAKIDIAGVIAHVRVTQVYENTGQVPIEAIYVFPGSTRAAVFGMRMTIGERTIEAKIDRKEAARKTYEAAKESGQTASLLEQHRPNVFQMNVANIMPGDTVRVQLDYTELMVPTDGEYELVYPAVVGPRYTGEKTSPETWHQNPYLSEGNSEPYGFKLGVHLSAGMEIHGLSSPSHTIRPEFHGKESASVHIGGPGTGNRDFILRYRLRGSAIQTGLLRFEGDQEKFFLLMVQPPKRVSRSEIPPREYVFIVDVSGSMSGFPLQVSKKMIGDLLNGLRPVDRFNLLFFAGGSYQLSHESIEATPRNIDYALRILEQQRGGGGTNLLAALKKALNMPTDGDVSRTFVAVTDGYVNVEAEAFQLVRKNLGRANFFAFGIGSSVNRHLIEGLARAGMGEPFVVTQAREANRHGTRFRKLIQTPALTNVKVTFNGMKAYDVEPLAVPDLLAERPLLVYGKYRGSGDGAIEVKGVSGRRLFRRTINTGTTRANPDHKALRYLWARARIAALDDQMSFEGANRKEEIETLGLQYNLLTKFTSFVAVDDQRRNLGGQPETVRQPVPLPQGVSNAAVGSSSQVITIQPRSASIGVSSSGEATRVVQSLPGVAHKELSYDSMETIAVTGSRTYYWARSDIRSETLSVGLIPRLALEQRLDVVDRGDTRGVVTPLTLRYRLARRIEARLGGRFALDEPGVSDVLLGTKIGLLSSSVFSLGLHANARIDREQATAEVGELRTSLLAAAALPARLVLRLNLGTSLLLIDEADQLGFLYAAELARLLGERSTLFFGAHGRVGDGSDFSLEGGANYILNRNLLLGVSIGGGLSGASDDFRGGMYLRLSI